MSFQQGLSGLNASSKNLEVIGNNIANANTYGNKGSRAEFADMYANSISGGGSTDAGIGVTLATISQQFTQGSITTTQNPLDLAINGGGFFQVTDPSGMVEYTRNGQFKLDRVGNIVNTAGQRLMGYMADAQGVVQTGQSGPIALPTGGISPRTTSLVDMEINLDSGSAPTVPVGGGIDFDDATTYNKPTSQTVYDARGQEVTLTYYFQKTGENTWDVYATANGSTISGTDAAPTPITTLAFADGGSAPSAPTGPVTINIPGTVSEDGATTEAIGGVAVDFSRLTEQGAAFAVTDLKQDGYAPGQLSNIVIEGNGVITARYSNGQSKPAGQIEMATFRNPQGLQPVGGNGWQRTFASGDPILGTPGEGNMGALQAGALEESNVDLTAELVAMITAQRNYQANAQTIKTVDQVMQTLVNLR
jgi:flagellar hook protein FlgE